jgi:hypothetical protein
VLEAVKRRGSGTQKILQQRSHTVDRLQRHVSRTLPELFHTQRKQK